MRTIMKHQNNSGAASEKLKRVLFYIQHLSENELASRVYMDLWTHGIEAERLPVGQAMAEVHNGFKETMSCDNPRMSMDEASHDDSYGTSATSLIITDLAAIAVHYRSQGYGVIVYLNEQNRGASFPDCPYAVEDFSGITYAYVDMVYHRAHGLPMEILQTKRCILREITPEDVPALYRIYSDPEITQYMEPLYEDPQEELEYTKQYIRNVYGFYGYGIWLVILKETGEIIGRAGIEQKEGDEPELGYMIAKPYQRQGIAGEVCHAILEYARFELGLEKLAAYVQSENTASIRLCEKLGLRKQAAGGSNYVRDRFERWEF